MEWQLWRSTCKNEQMTEPKLIAEVVARYFAALRSGDVTAIVSTFAEDAVSHDPVGAPAHVGHAGIHAFMSGVLSLFEAVGLTENQVFIVPGGAAVKWTGQGRGKNGRDITFEGIDVIEINDAGKIQTLRAYWDPKPMIAAITT